MQNRKKTLVDLIVSDPRIRNCHKEQTKENADKCIEAYEDIVKEFCNLRELEQIVVKNKINDTEKPKG